MLNWAQQKPKSTNGGSTVANKRISENPVLVNTLEKVGQAEFSIREFGSVSDLGSQTISLRTQTHCWLTPAVFRSLP